MTREKRKKVVDQIQKPRPKVRRDPLPIKIKAEHHLSSLLADGSATDLTVAAFERAQEVPPSAPRFTRGRQGPGPLGRKKGVARQQRSSGISDGIPSDISDEIPSGILTGIPSGIPDKDDNSISSNQIPANVDSSLAPSQVKTPYVHLDATRTANEQKLYSNLLRDLRRRAQELEPVYGKNAGRYGYADLLRLTGIRSRTTLRVAIEGLLMKEDIEILQRTKMGTIYRVREPKEILELRQSKGVLIDPSTKWIYSKGGKPVDWSLHLKRITGEARAVSLVADAHALGISDGIPDGIPERVSDRVSDGISNSDTPVYQNLTHLYKSINKPVGFSEENPSSNRQKPDDDGEKQPDDSQLHRNTVRTLYESYTGNKWRPSDETAYGMIKGLLLEVIEAGIISSVLRCPTRVNSLSYCLGAIFEFNDFLPPGYLLYLRKRFGELRGSTDRSYPARYQNSGGSTNEPGQ